jgi:hypothetical protein
VKGGCSEWNKEASEASEWSWWISNRLPDDEEQKYISNALSHRLVDPPHCQPQKEAW